MILVAVVMFSPQYIIKQFAIREKTLYLITSILVKRIYKSRSIKRILFLLDKNEQIDIEFQKLLADHGVEILRGATNPKERFIAALQYLGEGSYFVRFSFENFLFDYTFFDSLLETQAIGNGVFFILQNKRAKCLSFSITTLPVEFGRSGGEYYELNMLEKTKPFSWAVGLYHWSETIFQLFLERYNDILSTATLTEINQLINQRETQDWLTKMVFCGGYADQIENITTNDICDYCGGLLRIPNFIPAFGTFQADLLQPPYIYYGECCNCGLTQIRQRLKNLEYLYDDDYIASELQYYHKRVYKEFLEGKEGSLLDIGGGTGAFVKYIQENNPGIAACLVELNRKEVERAQKDGLKAYYGRVQDLSLQADFFDFITMFEVVEHVPLQEFSSICQTVLDKLKPGGIFIFSTPDGHCTLNYLFNMLYVSHIPEHIYIYTADWFKRYFTAHHTGFVVKKIMSTGMWDANSFDLISFIKERVRVYEDNPRICSYLNNAVLTDNNRQLLNTNIIVVLQKTSK